mmetsp:Transcript_28872/g.54264  ORF Transcript_28872/g.54264 Transcript_28872/m.54264 type:complete len:784 (+) Transcript_28872:444-2795(+)
MLTECTWRVFFFPSSSTIAPGAYFYSISSFIPRGSEDEWSVSVYLNDMLVDVQSGTGNSETFTYILEEEDISPPTQSPECDPLIRECCKDQDCAALEVCVQGVCINQGLPRFTLEYFGDDEIDLIVVTPFGTTLSASNPEDDLSGGRFEETEEEQVFGWHVDNVYLPLSGGPTGTYTYYIAVFDQNGSPDVWTVKVFEGDMEMVSSQGAGNADFLYEFRPSDGTPTPSPAGSVTSEPSLAGKESLEPTLGGTESFGPTPADAQTFEPTLKANSDTEAPNSSSPPVVSCQTPDDECCQDADCPGNEVCRSRICILDGNPRFTLTWNSGDDYDLQVTPPAGNTISFLNQLDEESGGRFGENGVQLFEGMQVENIYFPTEGGPVGAYVVEVTSSVDLIDTQATWTLEIAVDGEVVETQIGSGPTIEPISYVYEIRSNVRVSSKTCDISDGDTCCSDADCAVPEIICVARTCIHEGVVRFTLTWNGEDDLDLVLVKPDGKSISYYENPADPSDGIFEASELWPGRVSVPHVESIYLSMDAPLGLYKYRVMSFAKIGEDDPWTMQVFVDGIPAVAPHSGKGASVEYSFDYQKVETIRQDTSHLNNGKKGAESVESVSDPGVEIEEESDTLPQDEDKDHMKDRDCRVDSDCGQEMICLFQELCMSVSGPLHFTLSWTSSDNDVELHFSIITPDYEVYTSDEGLGTSLGNNDVSWSYLDVGSDWHVISLELHETSHLSRGTYQYILGESGGDFEPGDEWTFQIHEKGQEVKKHGGSSVGMAVHGYEYNPA